MSKQILIRAILSFTFTYNRPVTQVDDLVERKLGYKNYVDRWDKDYDWRWNTHTLANLSEDELLVLYNELEPQFGRIEA